VTADKSGLLTQRRRDAEGFSKSETVCSAMLTTRKKRVDLT